MSSMEKTGKKLHKRKHAKVPSVFQIDNCECGAASLSMILQYYGRYVGMEELREQCSVSRDGSDAAALVDAAEHYGLICKGYRKQVFQLREMSMPCIVHCDFSHFAVLEKINKRYVWLNDPAFGRRRISVDDFAQHYTGIVLTFEKTPEFTRNHNPNKTIPLIKKRFFSDSKTVLFMILVGLILIVPGLVIPQASQIFIDDVLIKDADSFVTGLLVIFVVANCYQLFFSYFRDFILARLRVKMSLFSNRELLHRVLRLPIRFFEQRYSGELSGRADNNNQVNTFLSSSFSTTIIDVFEALFYVVMMTLYSPVLTLIGLGGVLINVALSFINTRPLLAMSLKFNQDSGKNQGLLMAGLSVGPSIKANGVEDAYARSIMDSYARTTSSDQRLGRTNRILGVVPGVVSQIVSTVALVVGGFLIMNGECTTGTLTAFTMLLTSLNAPVNQIISMIGQAQNMRANMARVEDVLNAEPEKRFYLKGKENVHKLHGYLEARNLIFGYGKGQEPLIQNFSFKCTPGSRIAIVGASGCGKSTIGKLLSGMEKAWSGEILFDHVPIDEIPQVELTQSFGVVNQEGVIFSGSVRDNITLWNKNYSLKDLTRAVADADAEIMVNQFPDGYEYELSEGGGNLSGGQRQKIEIARALIKNPSILLLDEATSALDTISEQRIMNNLRRRGCTAVIIAHRLSTIRDCDVILVMDGGKVVECGNHEKLMGLNGRYKELVNC